MVTFRIPQINVIESDTGYSVEVLGRVGLHYSEGDRVLYIESEMLAGPAGLIVYSGSIRAETPSDEEQPIDSEERSRIIENVRAAFRFQGLEIQIA
jgi:hypothetical protein